MEKSSRQLSSPSRASSTAKGNSSPSVGFYPSAYDIRPSSSASRPIPLPAAPLFVSPEGVLSPFQMELDKGLPPLRVNTVLCYPFTYAAKNYDELSLKQDDHVEFPRSWLG